MFKWIWALVDKGRVAELLRDDLGLSGSTIASFGALSALTI